MCCIRGHKKYNFYFIIQIKFKIFKPMFLHPLQHYIYFDEAQIYKNILNFFRYNHIIFVKFFSYMLQFNSWSSPFRETTPEQLAKVEFLSFCYCFIWQGRSASGNWKDSIHWLYRKGPGQFHFQLIFLLRSLDWKSSIILIFSFTYTWIYTISCWKSFSMSRCLGGNRPHKCEAAFRRTKTTHTCERKHNTALQNIISMKGITVKWTQAFCLFGYAYTTRSCYHGSPFC